MADLRINDIDPNLLAKVKIAAIRAGKTLRQHVIDMLAKSVSKSAKGPAHTPGHIECPACALNLARAVTSPARKRVQL